MTLTPFGLMATGDTFRCGQYIYRKKTTKTATCLDAHAPHKWLRFEGWMAFQQVWLTPAFGNTKSFDEYIKQNQG